MNKKKIIIVLAIVVALTAIIVLVIQSRIKSGTIAGGLQNTGLVAPYPEELAAEPVPNYVAESLNTPPPNPIQVSGPSLGAAPGTADAPKQELIAADEIPSQAIKLDVSAAGFSPQEFTVKSGAEVVLALTSTDNNSHVFIFPNASLMGLITMVSAGQTKTITFNAPIPGSYTFRDDIPSYRGNTGIMIVE